MAKNNKQLIGVRLRPLTIKCLEEISEQKEMNLSELIREILERYIENC